MLRVLSISLVVHLIHLHLAETKPLLKTRRGSGRPRKRGFKASSGKVILFLDADDRDREEHIFWNLVLLTHSPEFGVWRTVASVQVDVDLHPDWLPALSNTLMQTQAMRRELLELTGDMFCLSLER
jgi:glycosyltransferase involved in cell wall biosynthesis